MSAQPPSQLLDRPPTGEFHPIIGLPLGSRNPPTELASHQATTLPTEVGEKPSAPGPDGIGDARRAVQSATRPPPIPIGEFGPTKATLI